MRRIVIAICGCAMGVALLAPATASAAPSTCAYNMAAGTLSVVIGTDDAKVTVQRLASSTTIQVLNAGGTPLNCGADTPTVSNVKVGQLIDTAAHDSTAVFSLQNGTFTPGDNTAIPDLTGPEIEFTYDGNDGTDQLEVDGTDNADTFDLGQTAPTNPVVNLNPVEDGATPDCDDVVGLDTENVIARGRGGDDDISAAGCAAAAALDPSVLTLEGGNQADFLRGGPGADSVKGGTQDDNVNGGAGDDSIDGERDNDKVDGGVGADAIEGGTETDRVLYDDRTTVVTATIGTGADDGGDQDLSAGVRDNIGFSVENLTGGSAGDSVTGSSVRNVVNAGLGDDVVLGLDGNDELQGEDGNDTLDGGGGKDELRGLTGTDTERGGGGSDQLFGGDSADKLLGGNAADVLKGDKGKDAMSGQAGNDKINAKDNKADKSINCGKGKDSKESAKVDKQDPKAKSC